MKVGRFIFIFMGFINSVFAQDTIMFVTRPALAVKVKEIGTHEIKYKHFDNPDGPLYIAAKNDIKYIKFENGAIDTIKTSGLVVKEREKMLFLDNKIFYAGRFVGDSRLLMLITKEPPARQKVLMDEYIKMTSHKRKQFLFFFGGVGAGITLMGISEIFISELVESNAPYIIGVAAGAAISATGIAFSIKHSKARKKKKIEIADHYNTL